MKRLLAISTLALLSSPAYAFACGAPFGEGGVSAASQDIVIVHKVETETYVFQPMLCGSARDFGLILPVPSLLSAQPSLVPAALFGRFDTLTRPLLQQAPYCVPPGPPPRDGGAGGGSGADAGADVVASGRVGFLDWVELQADTEAAFTSWLTANGYPFTAGAVSAFTYYVNKGWYFVAFKISSGADAGGHFCNALGPIRLSFPSLDPVVPARIATATGSGVPGAFLNWAIYALTEGDHQIDLALAPGVSGQRRFSGSLGPSDIAGLEGFAAVEDRLTKWTIRLDSTLSDDLSLTSSAPVDYREIQYWVPICSPSDGGTEPSTSEASAPTFVDASREAMSDGGADVSQFERDAESSGRDASDDGQAGEAAVEPEPTSNGCSCRTGGTARAGGGAKWALLGLVAAALARRRRFHE